MPHDHNHGHHHHHADLEGDKRVAWAVAVNIALTLAQIVAGVISGSLALIADAIHSLTDTTTDLAVIAGSHFWSRPPDENHPYGHQRLETLVTVFIGVMLAAAGIGIGWDAISTLRGTASASPGWI